ncbi:uncharacterized protein LOC131800872 [Musca domestica]|uniref:Uncharacterized protein LOC131800872 n=1 Tax=Musca domestica TaxID=7370 RepID=A0ABM3UMF9_MUSDO|nr:uncharacterized protein LOC131800872 [Musca domestica]
MWEAAVKSMKYHLKRIVGDMKLTYEEISTVLAQIEAVLNSRPLHELDSSPEHIDTLTPGHFIIGRPLLEAPARIEEGSLACVNRWKLLLRIKNHFWRKWKEEYLMTLQNRTKWRKKDRNLEVGQVVIIKNEETHPARWPLAKVTDVHPGKDGVVRVATVKTQDGELKRPINKLCPLEHVDNIQEDLQQKPMSVNTTRRLPNLIRNPAMMLTMIMNLCLVMSTKASSVKGLNSSSAMYLDPFSQIHMATSRS